MVLVGQASWFLEDYDIFIILLFKMAVIDLKVVDAGLWTRDCMVSVRRAWIDEKKSVCICRIHAIRIRFLNAPVPFCTKVAWVSHWAPGLWEYMYNVV